MREQRELPFESQVKNIKGKIKKLVDTFQSDHFDTNDMAPLGNIRTVPLGRTDKVKVLKYLNGIGEINILKEEGNYIEFKVTEKFGKIPNVSVNIPITEHIIESFNDKLPRMMEAYGLLASFENKLRFFISAILEKNKGDDWWETSIPKDVKDNIRDHRLDYWHIQLVKSQIQYTDFSDLIRIITKNWDIFKPIFNDQTKIKTFLESLEIPRNTIAHSNVLSDEMFQELKIYSSKIINLIDQYESKSA